MERIRVTYNRRVYEFRPCDTKGKTQEEVQALTDKHGRMQYEPHAVWLVVRGIGYGWEVSEDKAE